MLFKTWKHRFTCARPITPTISSASHTGARAAPRTQTRPCLCTRNTGRSLIYRGNSRKRFKGLSMKLFVVQIGLLVVLASAVVVAQQPSPPARDSGMVLHVTTRMVLVDAVVLDKQGHPVEGLKVDDFTLTEDGVPERIASFSERLSKPAKPTPPPVLPAHVTTNRPTAIQGNAEDGPVAVLLLDGLNTPAQDQIYVKQQMLKFLARQYDPSTKLAVI